MKNIEKLDWKKIASINAENIAEDLDFDTLQTLLSNIVHCSIDIEANGELDFSYLKLFKLCQSIIKYLLKSQDILILDNKGIEDELSKIKKFKEHLEKTTITRLKDHIIKLNNDLKNKQQTIKLQKKLIDSYNLKKIDNPYTEQNLSSNVSNQQQQYECYLCGKLFSSEQFLNSHFKRRHQNDLKEQYTNNTTENSQAKNSNLHEIDLIDFKVQQILSSTTSITKILECIWEKHIENIPEIMKSSDINQQLIHKQHEQLTKKEIDNLREQISLLKDFQSLLEHSKLLRKNITTNLQQPQQQSQQQLLHLQEQLLDLRKQLELSQNEKDKLKQECQQLRNSIKNNTNYDEALKEIEQKIKVELKNTMENEFERKLCDIKQLQMKQHKDKVEQMQKSFMDELNQMHIKQCETEETLEKLKRMRLPGVCLGRLEDDIPDSRTKNEAEPSGGAQGGYITRESVEVLVKKLINDCSFNNQPPPNTKDDVDRKVLKIENWQNPTLKFEKDSLTTMDCISHGNDDADNVNDTDNNDDIDLCLSGKSQMYQKEIKNSNPHINSYKKREYTKLMGRNGSPPIKRRVESSDTSVCHSDFVSDVDNKIEKIDDVIKMNAADRDPDETVERNDNSWQQSSVVGVIPRKNSLYKCIKSIDEIRADIFIELREKMLSLGIDVNSLRLDDYSCSIAYDRLVRERFAQLQNTTVEDFIIMRAEIEKNINQKVQKMLKKNNKDKTNSKDFQENTHHAVNGSKTSTLEKQIIQPVPRARASSAIIKNNLNHGDQVLRMKNRNYSGVDDVDDWDDDPNDFDDDVNDCEDDGEESLTSISTIGDKCNETMVERMNSNNKTRKRNGLTSDTNDDTTTEHHLRSDVMDSSGNHKNTGTSNDRRNNNSPQKRMSVGKSLSKTGSQLSDDSFSVEHVHKAGKVNEEKDSPANSSSIWSSSDKTSLRMDDLNNWDDDDDDN